MAEKAYRFISVGGKTFYFNINQTHGGTHNYLTIVAQKGTDSSKNEKMTMFPNQIGSFVHCLLETYAELCRKDEIGSPFAVVAPSGEEIPLEIVDSGTTAPSEGKFRCPECDTGIYDPNKEFSGYLWIHKIGTENDMIAVKCHQCQWHPEASKVSDTNGAVYTASSKDGSHWAQYATR